MSADTRLNPDRHSGVVTYTAWALLAWMAAVAVYLSRVTWIECDEFVFAHAAWLASQGQLPYRDFFEHHFPLVYQALAIPLSFAGDDPLVIRLLRVLMLPVLAAVLCCAWSIDRRSLGRYAVVTPAVLIATLPLTRHLTQVRPDGLAFALFLTAVCALYTDRPRPALRGLAIGLLLGLSCWASQKALVYGAVFAPVFLVDVLWNRHKPCRNLLGSPWAFLSGFGLVVAVVGVYLTATGTAWDFYRWCILWPIEHELNHPGYDWRLKLLDWLILPYPWLVPLALCGMGVTFVSWLKGRDRLADAEWVLLLAALSCLASFAAQSTPYRYSLIPPAAMIGLFASRGLVSLCRAAARLHREGRWSRTGLAGVAVLAVVVGGLHLTRFHQHARRDIRRTNRVQLATLSTLGSLTNRLDAVYDNSGSILTRPHAYFYYYTPWYIRRSWGTMLTQQVPAAIHATGATVFVKEVRYPGLPRPLKAYLGEHYQPYDTDIALWGRRYDLQHDSAEYHRVSEGQPGTHTLHTDEQFTAVRDDQYFVQPGDVIEKGKLWIDGQPVTERRFHLTRGEHEVRYEGPPRTFWLLWLPRHGRHWQPIDVPG